MTLLIQTVFSSVINGAVYALIGVGIVLCYRSSRIVNLAQGETYMVSGVLTAKMVGWGDPLWLSAICGVAAAVVGSVLFERLALRSRLHWDPARLIIVTVGVAVLAEGVADRLIGGNELSFPALLTGGSVIVDGAAISPQDLLLVGVTLVLTGGIVLFFRSTLLGHAMTAVAENPRVSGLLGINAGRMRTLSFGMAGLLGGISALLIVPETGTGYNVGLPLTLNGFAAAAFANMISPARALGAAMFLAVAEGFVGSYINTSLETPLVFGVLLVVGVAYLGRGQRVSGLVRA
jgi:branched-subunit amino acid ABC-type transport system permease component